MSYDDDTGSRRHATYDEPDATVTDGRYDRPGYRGGEAPPGYAAGPPRNGAGTTALVLGILALIFTVLFFPIGLVLALFAIGFAMVGRSRAKRGTATNRGAATTGMVLGVLSLIVGIMFAVISVFAFQQIRECIDPGMSQTEIRECIRVNIES
jgi:hypothetical protein